MQIQTRDLGLAIRDFLQDHTINIHNEANDELIESGEALEIVDIDVSNPDNPEIVFENGQRFIVCLLSK